MIPSPALTAFLRFAGLSGLGWLVDTALTVGLHARGLPLLTAALVGGSVAAGGVFMASRRAVFAATGSAGPGLALYVAYSAAMIVLASAALAALVEPVRALWPGPEAGVALLAKVVVTPPLLVMNFTMARTLSSLLRAKPPKPAEQ